jgi:oxygen-independent coproporphyrinogen-3 oxidase
MTPELLASYDRQVPRYTSYPTAPHFHAGIAGEAYLRWLERVPADVPLSLYLHIPYCRELCWFCGCHTKITRRYEPVTRYLDVLLREIDLVAGRLGRRQPVNQIHWGGGTPTILAPDDIRDLAGALEQHFDVLPEAEFAVEIDPRTVTSEDVRALAAAGVTRASLGVQDINPEVQRAINRWQPLAQTAKVISMLRAAGISALNIDLMYGLPKQTIDHVEATVDAVLELEPGRIALFGYAHVPWMKRHQRLIEEADLPTSTMRWAQAQAASTRLQESDYRVIGLDHFARPDDALSLAQAEGRLHRNFQGYTVDEAPVLLGLGASAIGTLPQGYVQNETAIPAYERAIKGDTPATVRGLAIDDEDRLRSAIIERLMCDLAVDLAVPCRIHGFAPDMFEPEVAALAPLQADGLVSIDGTRIEVPEAARPLVRVVCSVFDQYLNAGERRYARAV